MSIIQKGLNEECLSELCAPGTIFKEEMIAVPDNVSLRVITFISRRPNNNPAIIFVAGWISLINSWKQVLLEITRDFRVYYVETREKLSSQVSGPVDYSVAAVGRDIISLITHFNLKSGKYILLGSSLGATAILDCCRFLNEDPLCLVLIGANAAFQIPKIWMAIIRIFPPSLYRLMMPVAKWYLKTFHLDARSDSAQYEKYAHALDAADPYKLKKAAIALSKYEVWDYLKLVKYPTLIFGASKDLLHDQENLQRIVSNLNNPAYLDLETNQRTHSAEIVAEMRKYINGLLSA